jgi:6-phosphogluconolactonase
MATLHIQPDADLVVAEFAEWVAEQADESIARRGRFHWALSGGSTPQRLFSLLATPPWQERFPWPDTVLYWGDERDVPPTHPDSNFGVADSLLLRRLIDPPYGVLRWVTEYAPAQALADYRAKLQPLAESSQAPEFDVVLLGLGPEGHTASLFPHSPVLGRQDWVAHVWVPEHRSWRYTLSLDVINQAKAVAFLVTGREKREILAEIRSASPSADLPASLVQPKSPDDLHWFVDRAAGDIGD